jgi:hypothetical protein
VLVCYPISAILAGWRWERNGREIHAWVLMSRDSYWVIFYFASSTIGHTLMLGKRMEGCERIGEGDHDGFCHVGS